MKVQKAIILLGILSIWGCNTQTTEERVFQHGKKFIKQILDKDGKLVSEQELSKQKDGSKIADGYFKEYYAEGELKKLSYYQNGNKYGNQYDFYPSGNLKTIQIDIEGKPLVVNFDENGRKHDQTRLFMVEYADSVREGTFIPVVNQVDLYHGMNMRLVVKLFDSTNRIFGDTVIVNHPTGAFAQQLIHFDKRILGRGYYRYLAEITYTDEATREEVFTENKEISFTIVR